MNQKLRNFLSASAVSVMAFSAMAQDALKPNSGQPGQNDTQSQDRSDYNTDRPDDRDVNRMLRTTQTEQIKRVTKVSDLIGMEVQNYQDEKIGTVNDFAVDVESGRIVALIVSTGGFLGIGDELSAIPPKAFRFNADRKALQLNASKEMLTKAPHFKSNQWPDIGQPEYADRVYRAYQVEPYFKTKDFSNVENETRKERDQNDKTLTPFDQGNSKADVDITAKIRKEIIAVENMSVSGKNVKIITKDGRVTLRGKADSAEEKRIIGEIANRIARSENVDNQLEVKPATASN